MNRLPVLCFGVVFAATAALAQTSGAEQEASPDDEFTTWGEAKPPGAADPRTDPKKKKALAPATSQPAAPAEGAESSVDDWAQLPATSEPGATPPPPPTTAPPVVSAPPSPPPPPASTAPQRPTTIVKKPAPQEFNRVSIYGAPTLGQFKRGLGAYLGFPLLGIKAGIGLLDRLDVGLGFDSFYGVMNEPRAWVKLQLLDDKNWSASFQFEGGVAFFTQRPEAEGRGARWLTGRRNYNIEPGLVFSYRGDSVQSARLFLDVRYHLGLDTQPWVRDPLGGVPPPVVLGHNVPVRLGAEMPFSPSTSFLFIFGFDIHGREEDSRFMPVVSVGLVTGI